LDAFSAYPFRRSQISRALGRTTDTRELRRVAGPNHSHFAPFTNCFVLDTWLSALCNRLLRCLTLSSLCCLRISPCSTLCAPHRTRISPRSMSHARPVRGLLRVRHLALFADRGLLRTLHFAPCAELVSLHPQHLSPGAEHGLLRALHSAPCAEDGLLRVQPLAVYADPVLLRVRRFTLAPYADCSTLDT